MSHQYPGKQWLEKTFDLPGRNSNLSSEFRGAIATFLTMSYILFTNPEILRAAGIPFDSAVACTALAAGVCSLLMGIFANFPLALASGMGLNSFLAFHVAQVTGSWQTAMGIVVLDGIIVLLLVLVGLREAVMNAIPHPLKLAIGSGIGFFIAFIGLVNAKLVVVPKGTLAVLAQFPDATMPPVTYGSFTTPEAQVTLIGIALTAFLLSKRIKGAIIIGIFASTVLALLYGIAEVPSSWSGPNFEVAFQADIWGALKLTFIPILLALILVDFFDTLGTVTAIAEEGQLMDSNDRIPKLKSILVIDSISASIGGLCGVSSVTSYVESAAGVAEGARTGLHSIFVGLFFLLAIFLAPLAAMVPTAATAPALVLVGFLMCAQIRNIDFQKLNTAIPAFITLITIPLTYSISHGIGYGFITFVIIELLSGKAKEVHPLMYVSSAVFAAYFLWGVS